MIIVRNKRDLRRERQKQSGKVVFVPTMGALHAGHQALMECARREAGSEGLVIVSIFVNPTQFDRAEDLENYPSTFKQDLAVCEAAGVDLVFAPLADEIYEGDSSVVVTESMLSTTLCGARRPGHFDGVCTVVLKLYNLTHPDVMVFGKKDFQQVAVIQRMVRDLDLPVEILPVETVREENGLALSSRNTRLSSEAYAEAPSIYATLQQCARELQGGAMEPAEILGRFEEVFQELQTETRIDYVELVDAETMQPLTEFGSKDAILAVAVFFDDIRLIDHITVQTP